MADIFVYKNAIKPNYSPKWGNFGRVGNFVGIFANFSGNSGENFLATLLIVWSDVPTGEINDGQRRRPLIFEIPGEALYCQPDLWSFTCTCPSCPGATRETDFVYVTESMRCLRQQIPGRTHLGWKVVNQTLTWSRSRWQMSGAQFPNCYAETC